MIRLSFLLFLFIFLTNNIFAQMSQMKVLELSDAERIVNAAQERANQDNWTVAIAVVDAGGHLILLKKLDGTQIRSVQIATEKAQTAVYYKRPTKVFQDRVAEGNTGILGLPDAIPFEGGIPIEVDGKIIGAIGVSGVTAQQDGIVAQAGLDAL